MSLGIFFKQLLYKKASRDMDIPAVSNFKDVKIKVGDIVDITKSELSIPEASVIELTGVANTAGAYTATNVLTALDKEVIYLFKPSADSAVAPTLNVDSLGILPLKQFDGTGIVDLTELKAVNTYSLIYKDTYWLVNGGGGGGSAKFKTNILVQNALSRPFGIFSQNSTIPSIGKTVDEVFTMAFTQNIPHNYVYPSVNISPGSSSGEIGETVNITVSISPNQGEAGVPSNPRINDSADVQFSGTSKPVTFLRTAGGRSFTGTYNFAAGLPIAGSDGIVSNTPPIIPPTDGSTGVPAGDRTSGTISFTGYNLIFYGIGDPPVNYRSGLFVVSAPQLLILNTGTTLSKFWVWMPTARSLTLVKDPGNLDADITAQWIETTASSADASGASVPGKVYIYDPVSTYTASSALKLTIS